MSECDLCVYTGADSGDGLPEFCEVTWPKTRKERKCVECNRTIAAGEKYQRSVGKWDGEFGTFSTCAECAEIREAFCCEGFYYGSFWNDATDGEFFEHMATGCLDKLKTSKAKAFLLARWSDWKFKHSAANVDGDTL